MLFFLTSRVISSLVAFLYPGYASYKTLSQRPASEEDLERWLMYWCVLGCVVGVEYIAEWVISWIPFYYTLKTIFLIYLALPQTKGSSYLYTHHLQPFFRTHETQIDTALASIKAKVYAFVQQRARMVWDQAAIAMGQSATESAEGEESRRGGGADGIRPPAAQTVGSGPAQLVSNLWTSYGPGILAGGMALVRQATSGPAQALSGSDSNSGSGAGRKRPGASMFTTPPGSHIRASSGGDRRQSVDDRKKELEAELAALNVTNIEGLPVMGGAGSGGTSTSRSSSDSAVKRNVAGHRRNRSGSGGSGRFEEVEVPSDVEGYDVNEEGEGYVRGQAGTSGSGGGGGWFGWGSATGKGYERVKSE